MDKLELTNTHVEKESICDICDKIYPWEDMHVCDVKITSFKMGYFSSKRFRKIINDELYLCINCYNNLLHKVDDMLNISIDKNNWEESV